MSLDQANAFRDYVAQNDDVQRDTLDTNDRECEGEGDRSKAWLYLHPPS